MWSDTEKQQPQGGRIIAPNGRFDGSVGVFASLAAVMSPMRQLLALLNVMISFSGREIYFWMQSTPSMCLDVYGGKIK